MTLHPCPRCHRHIDAREPTCPFCGVPNEARASRSTQLLGRASRAAVFAGLTACWTGPSTPPQTPIEPVKEQTARSEVPMVRGVVMNDISGLPLVGIEIELVDYSGNKVASTRTNGKGEYQFATVAPGEYFLRARYGDQMHGGIAQLDIRVVANEPERHDITISYGDNSHMAKPYGAPPARRRLV